MMSLAPGTRVSLTPGTPVLPTCGDNGTVGSAETSVTGPVRRAGGTRWALRAVRDERIVRANMLVIVAGLLCLAAVIESIVRHSGRHNVDTFVLLVTLVGVATTVPVVLRNATAAAAVVTTSCVLSLTAFHTLTGAGIAAQVVVAYRLGRSGWLPLAVVAGLPFLVVALARPPGAYVRIVAVVLAAVVPAVALAGIVGRARREDAENRAARHAIADTLLEHTARGERARIARELHDVVAHHISMIVIQAETARLTTPGMPT